MICKNCGTEADIKFGVCPKCGAMLKSEGQPRRVSIGNPSPRCAPMNSVSVKDLPIYKKLYKKPGFFSKSFLWMILGTATALLAVAAIVLAVIFLRQGNSSDAAADESAEITQELPTEEDFPVEIPIPSLLP